MICFVCDGQNINLEQTKTGEMMGVITLSNQSAISTCTKGELYKGFGNSKKFNVLLCKQNLKICYNLQEKLMQLAFIKKYF